jgi:hypothetical protein
MREDMVKCQECRFWHQYVNEHPILDPRLSDYGLCLQSRSVNWGLHIYRDRGCEHGELKKKEIPPPKI